MPAWTDMNIQAKAKKVAVEYFRGLSVRAIASKYNAEDREIKQLIQLIDSREARETDLDTYLSDLKNRTRDQLRSLDEQKRVAYEALDWAKEMVPLFDPVGEMIQEKGPDGKWNGMYVSAPRNVVQISKLLQRIGEIDKQRSELLKLIGPKVDLTIQLQMALQKQDIIMEVVQSSSPEVYAQIYRQLQAIATEPEIAMTAIEGEFREID